MIFLGELIFSRLLTVAALIGHLDAAVGRIAGHDCDCGKRAFARGNCALRCMPSAKSTMDIVEVLPEVLH
jgi:hypothetical protein